MNTATVTTPYASPFSPAYTSEIEGNEHYRPTLWNDSHDAFKRGMVPSYGAARKVWHEAQWLDVLHDAYAEKAAREGQASPVELSAHERDVEAARRQAEALGATFAQREKLRAIVTERRDAQAALATAQETINELRTRVSQLQNEQITDGSDHRLTEFWERAAQKASDENYCGEYDRMAELLGGPGRVKTYDVTTRVTIEITVQVEARSDDDAVEQVDDFDHVEMERIIGNLSYYDVNIEEIDAREANESN